MNKKITKGLDVTSLKRAADVGDATYYKQNSDTLLNDSFCSAKWLQLTSHLQNGHNHSCHHPMTHKVPMNELKENPAALHNTNYKKKMRAQMLNGVKPSECDYCWRVQDASPDAVSDRIHKTMSWWAIPKLEEVLEKEPSEDIDPTYWEVSFGNVCNFKCAYCAPHISSQWMEEVERFGGYQLTEGEFNNRAHFTHNDRKPIPNREYNPYVDAFWKYFPEVSQNLYVFRITGGEPLLNKNTMKVLDYLIEEPHPNMQLAINTNMNVPKSILNTYIEKLKRVQDNVSMLQIYTSAEAHGEASNYIRFGMNYDEWLENMYTSIEELPIPYSIMSTYNFLSMPSFDKFIKDVGELKSAAGTRTTQGLNSEGETVTHELPLVDIDVPYLRHPEFLSIFLARGDSQAKKWIADHMLQAARAGFSMGEKQRIMRLSQVFEGDERWSEQELIKNREDFIMYIKQYDERRGTDFRNTFPELVPYFDEWSMGAVY